MPWWRSTLVISRARHTGAMDQKRHRSGEFIAGAARRPLVVLRSPEELGWIDLFQSRARVSHLAEIRMDNYEGRRGKIRSERAVSEWFRLHCGRTREENCLDCCARNSTQREWPTR